MINQALKYTDNFIISPILLYIFVLENYRQRKKATIANFRYINRRKYCQHNHKLLFTP